MVKKTEKNLIVGLDIGTSKVVAIVGEVLADGELEVVGIGSHPSRGLKKGVVVNIESTVHSIQRAIEEAELMAGCQIHSVYAGIAGSLYAITLSFIGPEHFTFLMTIEYLAMGLVGGIGTILGSIFGALFMTALPEVIRFLRDALSSHYPFLDLFVVLS